MMKLLLGMALLSAAAAALPPVAGAGPYDGWKPLGYCNAPERMEAARIPPLTASQAEALASLEQVQVLARHGARAPYTSVFCWENEEHNPMNAEWKCGASSVSSQDIGTNATASGFGRLYGKQYMDGRNILHGDCVVGGLLSVGRKQHLKNGQFLRDAYIGEGPLKLFPTTNLAKLPLDRIYLRSDDEERTVGSGHALMDGFFPPGELASHNAEHMLTWNVADYAIDYINSNEHICPMLTYIWNESMQSEEYKKKITDPARIETAKRFESVVGKFSWDTALECLATTRCNDLPPPKGLDEELFDKVFHEVEAEQGLQLAYSSAWYSKVAMQPLALDVISRVDKVTDGVTWAPKLAVTMGHDSTLMPLLAALLGDKWDRTWTPYAGMVVIEVYKTKSKSTAARLIFHGEALVLPGCNDSLCDIEDFFRAFEFARTDRDCSAPASSTNSPSSSTSTGEGTAVSSVASSDSASGLGLLAVAAILVAGVALGVAVFVFIRRRKNRREATGHAYAGLDDEQSLL